MKGGTVPSVVHRTAQIRPNNPLFYDHGSTRKCFSYYNCWEAVEHHQAWLTSHVAREVTKRGRDVAHGAHTTQAVEVVVAYLAVNSPDYLLSVLACTAVTTTGARVRPALLNYRWTDGEISRALRVQEPKGTATSSAMPTKHVTILLYGDGFEQIASKVVGMIQTDPVQSVLDHCATSIRLPSLLCVREQPLQVCGFGRGQGRASNNSGGSGADDALILFTSGTSSSSGAKGVRLSHNSLTVQAMAKLCPPCSYDEHSNMVATTVPFFHVGGLSSALAIIMAGGTLTFPPTAKPTSLRTNTFSPQRSATTSISFQPNRILRSLNNGQASANTLVVVPAMVHALLEAAAATVYPNVRLLLVGGQSLSGPQLAQTRRVFPNARVVQTYACTEAGSSITFAQLHPLYEEHGSSRGAAGDYVGFAPAHVEMKVVPVLEDGAKNTQGVSSSLSSKHATASQSGIIATRGPHVMNGYWQRGNEVFLHVHRQNRVGLTSDGWLLTNDLGLLDVEGRLYFSGRASDVIRSGGESIPASEVERTILSHPLVHTCAVFPLPDERFGEAVCVAVVLKERASTTGDRSRVVTMGTAASFDILAEVKRHCTNHGLAPYKRPRRAFILPELPTNSSGKVLKHQLVKMFGETKGKGKEGDDMTPSLASPSERMLRSRL